MATSDTALSPARQPWYRSLTRAQWNTLAASNLGWMLDGYETYALILCAVPALRALLDPSELSRLPVYVGQVFAITLLGWGIGGIIGGIVADYIGRKRTMLYAIAAYSLLTGLSAFAQDWSQFALLRFLAGLAIGSEWATGSSMMAEVWPDNARGKGAGLMQCGLGIGFFIASAIWVFVGPGGPDAWRTMFLIGVLPAFVTLWIRRAIDESSLWERSDARRRDAINRRDRGETLGEADQALSRFTFTALFADRATRAQTIRVFLMSLTTTVGFWAISTWVPPFVASMAGKAGLVAAQWAPYAGMAYTTGSILGYASFGFLADRFGRRPVTMSYFALALLLTPVLFLWTTDPYWLLHFAGVNAFFSNGQYTWMPVWLPELYPTRMRATAMAFAFNAPRLIAFLGPLLAGQMIAALGGFGKAAMTIASIYVLGFIVAIFVPETRGKSLPE